MAKRAIVLLVEDDIQDVEIMRLAFERAGAGFSLISVADGGEAIRYLSGSGKYADRRHFPEPSLVLLDLALPQVDGFDVLRWMKDHPSAQAPPVIVLSYARTEEEQRLVENLGASACLTKAVDLDSTVSFVKGLDRFSRSEPAPSARA